MEYFHFKKGKNNKYWKLAVSKTYLIACKIYAKYQKDSCALGHCKTCLWHMRTTYADQPVHPLASSLNSIFVIWLQDGTKPINEPPPDKTNKMACTPSKGSVRLGGSAQSDQSLRCPHEESLVPQLPIESTSKTLIRLIWVRWVHMSVCWFCHEVAQMQHPKFQNYLPTFSRLL